LVINLKKEKQSNLIKYFYLRCGFGGEGEPVDDIDACCKAHDQCYDDIKNFRTNILPCSPYLRFYNWDLDSKTFLPICKDKSDSCAYRICECDRIVTECYKENAHKFNKSLKCLK
jgi:secretory phospholipase A2